MIFEASIRAIKFIQNNISGDSMPSYIELYGTTTQIFDNNTAYFTGIRFGTTSHLHKVLTPLLFIQEYMKRELNFIY